MYRLKESHKLRISLHLMESCNLNIPQFKYLGPPKPVKQFGQKMVKFVKVLQMDA